MCYCIFYNCCNNNNIFIYSKVRGKHPEGNYKINICRGNKYKLLGIHFPQSQLHKMYILKKSCQSHLEKIS